ncbi:MAG: threonine synthase [Bacteroidota bacterium]
MKFFSTNRKSPSVSFKDGVIKSLPVDNGLYYPETIPDIRSYYGTTAPSLPELGYEVMAPFAKMDIPTGRLHEIVEGTLSFDIPLVPVSDRIQVLELFHGPTYAFKDVGARFLARCLGYFNEQSDQEVTILVATSGDTGGAVASGFYQVEGVEVVILYPSGKVSDLQEKQLTTLGHNITAYEIDGNFDDCQALVKKAFLDKELNKKLRLSSANSINIARWIPQSIYYGWAHLQAAKPQPSVFAVPSGNYGNLAAGMLAKKMGAPLGRFIASSNANDVVPRYLASASYDPTPTIATYSNAMDVGKPSNFPRMLELYDQDHGAMIKDVQGFSLGDEETLQAMEDGLGQDDYLLDPHGAIGYAALATLLAEGEHGVFLETAHPCKFADVIRKIKSDYELPDFTQDLMEKRKQATAIEANYDVFKELLLK